MIILAIETSCDDTCAAIVRASGKIRSKFKILANIISSQVEIHRKWGGVYPALAQREHKKNLLPSLLQVLNKSKISNFKFLISNKISNDKFQIPKPKIDLIAVTIGPGLEPCLWTGINFAKKLAEDWNLPLVPVNHIEGHILASLAGSNPKLQITNSKKNFPAVCLIVSGGHTQLILMQGIGKYKIIGETRDDAAGECFDKTARILGLEYPGGPAIAAAAAKITHRTGRQIPNKLPRPMLNQKNYDFSFSGLKTAVLYKVRGMKYEEKKKKKFIQAMAKEIQQAIIDVLIKKTIKAAKDYRGKTIILGGGVAANSELRKQIKKKFNNVILPPKNFCTDNAAMIGIAGYFNWLKGETKSWKKIKAEANLRIK